MNLAALLDAITSRAGRHPRRRHPAEARPASTPGHRSPLDQVLSHVLDTGEAVNAARPGRPLAAVRYETACESVLVMGLHGELDVTNRVELARACATFRDRCVVAHGDGTGPPGARRDTRTDRRTAFIDACDLRFIDAAALNVLVALCNTLANDGIQVHTIDPPTQLQRISGICHLDETLGLAFPQADPIDENHPSDRSAQAFTAASLSRRTISTPGPPFALAGPRRLSHR